MAPRLIQVVAIVAIALVLPAAARADRPAKPDRQVELFPAAALEPIAQVPQPASPRAIEPRKEAKSPALSFDTGDGWKGDAAMTGALAGAFAALVALCRGGACMLK